MSSCLVSSSCTILAQEYRSSVDFLLLLLIAVSWRGVRRSFAHSHRARTTACLAAAASVSDGGDLAPFKERAHHPMSAFFIGLQ
jgi:hypothetical protein